MIAQLPPEILKIILGLLEPIWLFQAEAAYPEIALLSSNANFLWYNAIPPALQTEPEYFQDEDKLSKIRSKGAVIVAAGDR